MRRATLLVCPLLLALATAFSPARAAETEAPEVTPTAVVAEPTIDAGTVAVGEPIEAEFVIENQGEAPLRILGVQPACGCTVAEFDETIEPGGSGTVRAVVDTTGEAGPNVKAITVRTNDPETPRLQLSIKSNVKTFLAVDPGYARFSTFVRDDRDQGIPQLLWVDDFEELEVTGAEAPTPWIDVTYREATAAERSEKGVGRQWRIDVTLSKDAPIGPVADRVLVRTNHPRQKVFEIPVSGFVRPLIAVMPEEVDLGRIDPSEAREWGILVRNFGTEPLSIESIESSVAGMEVTVQPLQEGHQYRLVLTPTAEMPKGPFQGSVELATNLPKRPKLTVSFQGEVL
jgi:hypothetical protein